MLETMPLMMRTIGRAMRLNAQDASPLLPQQYRLLGAIARKPRTLGQIALIQGVTPATATTLVSTLESRGWVARASDPDDRRKVVVSLTPDGRATLLASQRVVESAMADLLSQLTQDQLEQLHDGLSVLRDLQR